MSNTRKKQSLQLPLLPVIKAIDSIATDPMAKVFLYAALGAALVHMVKHGMITVEEEPE